MFDLVFKINYKKSFFLIKCFQCNIFITKTQLFSAVFLFCFFVRKKKLSSVLKIDKIYDLFLFHVLLTSNPSFYMIFRKTRSELLPQIFNSSFQLFVFFSALWEQMTNDKEISTSCSLKRQEKFDLSLLLTCTTSLYTCWDS